MRLIEFLLLDQSNFYYPMGIKHIKPILSDIHHPKSGNTKHAVQKSRYFASGGAREPLRIVGRAPFVLKVFKWGSIGFLIVVLLYLGYLIFSRNDSLAAARGIYSNLKLAGRDLADLDTDSVGGLIRKINADLAGLQAKVAPLNLVPIANRIPKMLGVVGKMSADLSALNSDLARLKSYGLKMLGGVGENDAPKDDLVAFLKDVSLKVEGLREDSADLRNNAAAFNFVSGSADGEYLKLSGDLEKAQNLLNAVIAFMELPGERHILVVFQNATEIRPAGGFVGSYGDAVFQNGRLIGLNVNDIYYPSRFSTDKIVPPRELQGITTKWGPQDANWFFDFPVSARKTSEFIENSSVYSDKKITFDGVIGINVLMIQDLLKITGPIEVPEYNMLLTADNFISTVQKEVEEGRDKIPGQNPKKVLTFIVPKLMAKLGALDQTGESAVQSAIRSRFDNKDIQFYFKNAALQGAVSSYNAAGEVFSLPNGWNGDYLAVVNANVAGGKSDAFISQSVKLVSKIDSLGNVTDDLAITRTHSGKGASDRWYRATNQNYIKIFTPLGTSVDDLKGASLKTIYPSINYVASGYKTDPDLSAVESAKKPIGNLPASLYSESGKSVIGAWFNIPSGESRSLNASYTLRRKADLSPGTKFEFMFEKQSGVDSSLDYALTAPYGFVWAESGDQNFHYFSTQIPKRLIIDLTIQKSNL